MDSFFGLAVPFMSALYFSGLTSWAGKQSTFLIPEGRNQIGRNSR